MLEHTATHGYTETIRAHTDTCGHICRRYTHPRHGPSHTPEQAPGPIPGSGGYRDQSQGPSPPQAPNSCAHLTTQTRTLLYTHTYTHPTQHISTMNNLCEKQKMLAYSATQPRGTQLLCSTQSLTPAHQVTSLLRVGAEGQLWGQFWANTGSGAAAGSSLARPAP